jgi:hypothetical protein
MITPLLLLMMNMNRPRLSSSQRALWVWKSDAIVSSPVRIETLFKFIAAPKGDSAHKIDVLFFDCHPTQANQVKLKSFLRRAHACHLRVDYLCGEATYATPLHAKAGLDQLQSVLQFNRQVPATSRFDGIQYDVEPYSLPQWPRPSLLAGFMDFYSQCRAEIGRSGQALSLGAAIPRWFDTPQLHDLYKSILNRVDYVAVMDYVNNPQHFVSDGYNTVRYAGEIGKAAWLGAEVSELPTEKTATFFALGNAKLEEAFTAAETAYKDSPGFAGVAIEWYDTYVDLKP